ncbi:dna damage repair mus42 protein [Rutstroemia sp. NJR-2017a BBW]|nr:dna damage repair mus42 protein [Rutstroemia sp. NJR-2017a BBW]
MQYLDGKTTVTHIIASTLTPKKAIEFKRYRIVKPAWVVDSVKAGKCLPWDSYRVLDEGVGQRLLGFNDGKVVSQSNTPKRGYHDQTNASWYTSQVKNVAKDIDDNDGHQLQQSIEVVAPIDKLQPEDPISSAGSFEVSSSLEDVLKHAANINTVSLKSAPEFVDKPAVVAHGSGTGSEIASCNYPARAFGVKNGMWMKNAIKLCPDIKVLPYDFPAYEEASNGFYEAILDIGGVVQSVSVDEALIDVTSLCLPAGGTDGFGIQEGSIWREQEMADQIGEALRVRIKKKTGCAVSIGIGGNILLAKLALRKAKPAGQYQIKPEEVLDFIGDFTVQDLPGVAHSIGGKLEEIGVKFVKDVRQLSKDRLMTVLGPKTGERIWDYARGIDKTEVGEQVVRKSVSAEVNWGIRFISQSEAEEFVSNLCLELQRRLVDQRVKGRQLSVKIMRKAADAPLDPPKFLGHGSCDTFNKSITLGVATNSSEIIAREAISVLRSYGFPPGELRGLGVQMTKLEAVKSGNGLMVDGSQRRINFGAPAPSRLRKEVVGDPIVDDVEWLIKRGTTPSTPRRQARLDDIIHSASPLKYKSATKIQDAEDPIDESSPLKAKQTPIHPATIIARTNAGDQSARKLNMMGTQFIIPSQIDPDVLNELPQDIRSKLLAQSKSRPVSRDPTPAKISRSESPAAHPSIPLPSQLDPEVFDALPEDMKAEILASYNPQIRGASAGPSAGPSNTQTLFPQSPRKHRTLTGRPPPTPIKKRGRGRPPKSLIRPEPPTGPQQSKFTSKPVLPRAPSISHPPSPETLDPEFLSALPEDMRLELLSEHRRNRLQKRGNLITTTVKKVKKPDPPPLGPRRIRLPPKAKRPTFTTRELCSLEELRETLGEWYEAFEEEGPLGEDVRALERYLRRVVLEERDLGKVMGVVKWLGWLVEGGESEGWREALRDVRGKVQEAVGERGLGRLDI